MSLLEDKTIFDVKRLLVEGVRSSLSASQLEIRTSSGMLLGQDHSLRYVRTILWPPCKGKLVLKYSLRKDQLF